MRPPE